LEIKLKGKTTSLDDINDIHRNIKDYREQGHHDVSDNMSATS